MSRTVAFLVRGGDAEKQILEGLRRGDVASYRHLYEMYASRLSRIVLRIFRDPQLAQDAVQSTFLAVFRHVHKFDGRSALLTWMTRIALREAQTHARRQAQAQRTMQAARAALPTESAEEPHESREQIRTLERLLAHLSEEKRTALLLFEVEGFSVQEIADVTGEPRGTVLARLSRTRAELRDAMQRRGLSPVDEASSPHSGKSKTHGQ